VKRGEVIYDTLPWQRSTVTAFGPCPIRTNQSYRLARCGACWFYSVDPVSLGLYLPVKTIEILRSPHSEANTGRLYGLPSDEFRAHLRMVMKDRIFTENASR
jgi:hypothetical protein